MRVIAPTFVAALVLVSVAAAGSSPFELRPVATTGKTVTLTWKPPPKADGYEFLRNGVVVSRTFDRSVTRATFWKGSRYAVVVLRRDGGRVTKVDSAVYVAVSRKTPTRGRHLVFVSAPKIDFRLHLVRRTSKTLTFSWKRQPGADGYQFMRNGVVVSRTFDRSTTSATFWKGTRYAVHVVKKAPGKQVVSIRRAVVYATKSPRSAGTRLVSVPAPKTDFALRLVGRTGKTVTFAWKRQPGADGYQFLRNGVIVSRTFDRSTTTATFWKGTRYAVQMLRRVSPRGVAVVTRALAYTSATTASTAHAGARTPAPTPSAPSPGSSTPKTPPSSSPPPTSGPAAGGSSPPPATSNPPPPSTSPPPPPPPSAPPPPSVGPGGTVTLTGSYSPSTFFAAVALAPPGPVTVTGGYTVTGDVDVTRPSLRIDRATIQGVIEFGPEATGSSLTNSSAMGFNVWGADNMVFDGNTFDGQGQVASNQLWDRPAGNTPDGWVIRNNVFRNFYKDGSHSEAVFVGYASDGLIEGNTFTNNGNTSHIFFSYFGTAAYEGTSPSSTYPRNMCVRGNTFNETHGAYYDVNFREEIPSNANIKIQRDASSTDPEFYADC